MPTRASPSKRPIGKASRRLFASYCAATCSPLWPWIAALEALEELPTVWYASSFGLGIDTGTGQSAKLYRKDGEWFIDLRLSKTTHPLRDLFALGVAVLGVCRQGVPHALAVGAVLLVTAAILWVAQTRTEHIHRTTTYR